MRVVTVFELCKQPDGAIFSEWVPAVVTGLYRRGLVIRHTGSVPDFYYHSLLASPDLSEDAAPESPKFWDLWAGSRWGLFDPDEKFVLYEADDVRQLRELLGGAPCS